MGRYCCTCFLCCCESVSEEYFWDWPVQVSWWVLSKIAGTNKTCLYFLKTYFLPVKRKINEKGVCRVCSFDDAGKWYQKWDGRKHKCAVGSWQLIDDTNGNCVCCRALPWGWGLCGYESRLLRGSVAVVDRDLVALIAKGMKSVVRKSARL